MSSRAQFNSPEAIARRKAEGRGLGEGPAYRPWITIYDFASWGLRFRSYSHISRRPAHTLSVLERLIFILAECEDGVEDLNENLPLLDTTKSQDIASDEKIKHPRAGKNCPIVMSTDLRLTLREKGKTSYKIWTTKYTDELRKWRTLEKLRIDEIYWSTEKDYTWELKTEADLPDTFLENMKWLRPMLRPGALYGISPKTVTQVEETMRPEVLAGNSSLVDVATWCDAHLHLNKGTSQLVVRYLLASRAWRIDLRKPLYPLLPLPLQAA